MVHHLTEPEIPEMLRALHLADGITTVSQRWKERLEALTGRDVTLIPNTVDAACFVPREDRDTLRVRAGIPAANFVVGYVGKVSANANGRKRLDLLQRVLEGAADRWQDLTVLLVGPGWESLAAHFRARGVDVQHREFETTEETSQMYPLMDALVVTSVEEGGPCTILESMACGVPAVTSNVGHVPEVVEDGVTGFICETRLPEEYLTKLALIRDGAGCTTGMGARARAFILAERDESVVLPKVDFGAIYSAAHRHFATRSSAELAMRRMVLLRLGLRYVVRLLLRRGTKPLSVTTR
jgi:glycosyltransferase involved in cell wall biosynthesis